MLKVVHEEKAEADAVAFEYPHVSEFCGVGVLDRVGEVAVDDEEERD